MTACALRALVEISATMARKRILITKKALEEDKHAVWNAFIDLLATTDCDELAPSQRLARLAFLYDCEVLNGGPLQFFNNRRQGPNVEAVQVPRFPCGPCAT